MTEPQDPGKRGRSAPGSAAGDKAEEAVLFAEDAFPQSQGVEKLRKAIEYLKGVLAKAGIKITDAEAEAKVRAAYQRLQGEAMDRILERLKGGP